MTPYNVGDTVRVGLTGQTIKIEEVDATSDDQPWYRSGGQVYPHSDVTLVSKGVRDAHVEHPENDDKL